MLYVNRPGILPTTIKNRLSHDRAGLRSSFCFHRTGIQPHDVVLSGGNEERFTIGDTNAGSGASLLNMFGIHARGQPHPHVDTIRTGPAATPEWRYDLIQGGAHLPASLDAPLRSAKMCRTALTIRLQLLVLVVNCSSRKTGVECVGSSESKLRSGRIRPRQQAQSVFPIDAVFHLEDL
jgi:hypothetical protein